jgi:ATP-binding cassette subfamily C (CFTR/MRP) protein 1
LIAFVPIALLFYFLQEYFRSAGKIDQYLSFDIFIIIARELKRLDAISRSPIYANFSETLNGLSTIRAYKAQERMANLNIKNLDKNQRIVNASNILNRWLSMR